MARTFTDIEGNDWTVEITVADVKALRTEAEVDLFKIADTGFKPIADLLDDPVNLVEALWIICRRQAEQANIDADQFGRRFGGDSLMAAGDALLGAIVDFFPNPRTRAGLQKLMAKGEAVRDMVMDRAEATIDGIDPSAEADRLSESFTNSLASQASTHAP